MHGSGRRAVETGDEMCARVSERDSAARCRDTDLAGMEMPREDQVERVRWHPVDDAREVTEQESKRGVGIDEPIGPRPPGSVRDGIDAGDQQPLAVSFERRIL